MCFVYNTEIPLVLNQSLTFGAVQVERECEETLTGEVYVMDFRRSEALKIPVTPKLLEQLTACGVPNRLATGQVLEFPGIAIGRKRSESGEMLTYFANRGIQSLMLDDGKFGWRQTSGIKITLLVDFGTVKEDRSGSIFTPRASTYKWPVENTINPDDTDCWDLGPSSINQHCWTDASSQWKTIISLTLRVTRNGGEALALTSKMLGEDKFCDVKLIADNGAEIKFHKNILATHSPVFANMFSADMKEAKTGTMEMPGMCETSVWALREYLYTWNLDEADSDPVVCLDLLQAGHQYDIGSMASCMEGILLRKSSNWYTVDVAWRLFNWAKVADLEELKLKAVGVLKSRISELFQLPAYLECFEENRVGPVNDLMMCFANV